jgi:uncharacterized repeat protein (TIGR02543 family)
MKKYSWIMALLLALTLAFIGCPTDGGGGGGGGGCGGGSAFTSDLVEELGTDGVWEVTLEQTEYSDGAQVQMDYPELMQGNKVTVGDVYELEITFTVDRVPTTPILFYLVDNTEAAYGWWRTLTNRESIAANELTVGTPYTVTLSFTATGTASSNLAGANKLCIETTEGKAPSWPTVSVNPILMTFTTFKFSRLGDVYAVTFIVEDGEFDDETDEYSIIVNAGSAIGNKAPANPTSFDEGLEFDYWCAKDIDAEEHTSHTPFVMTTSINGPIVLHAVWKAKAGYFTVTFKDAKEDGTDIWVMSVEEDGTITKPQAVTDFEDAGKSGYEFVGWVNAADDTDWDFATGQVTANIVLYPKWEEKPPCECASAAPGDHSCDCDAYQCPCADCTICYPSTFTITFGTTPVTFDVTDVQTSQGLTVKGVEGGIEISGPNYNNAIAAVSVDLGTKTLLDYESVKLDFVGIAGDFTWKRLALLAVDTDTGFATGYGWDRTTYTVSGPDQTAQTGSAALQPIVDYTIPIDPNKVASLPSEVDIFIFLDGGTSAVYRFLNITFVERATSEPETVSLPVTGIAPIAGGTPTNSIETTEFTGNIVWDPVIAEGDSFAVSTIYTATITLTAKFGYTFTGVAENAFVVNGASVTNAAGSGGTLVITAVFPETEGAALEALEITFEEGDVVAVGGTVEIIDLDDENGYTFTYTAGYGSAFASFQVPLPDGVVLSKYSSITFTFQGLGGDVRYKDVNVLAWDESFTGNSIGGNPPASGATSDDGFITNIGTTTPQIHATTEYPLNITLTGTDAFDEAEEVWISIYIHAGADKNDWDTENTSLNGTTKFCITNITLNP